MTLANAAAADGPCRRARRLHPHDLACIGIVLISVLAAVSQSLRVPGAWEAGILTFGWSCAATRRLITWRAGSAPHWELPRLTLKPRAVIVFGAAPWILLPVAQQIAQQSWLWRPMALPVWLRSIGAVLTLTGAVRPPRGASEDGSVPAWMGECVDVTGFALLSASPLIAVMVALGIRWAGRGTRT